MDNHKIQPYREKMKALKIQESLFIPKDVFLGWPPKESERAVSDGRRTWILSEREMGLEIKRIE